MTRQPETVVIGSGPAGVACAHALARAGRSVLMLDAGRQIEPERGAILEGFQGRPAPDADSEALPGIRRATHAALSAQGYETAEGAIGSKFTARLKPVYGSLFPYAHRDPALDLSAGAVGIVPSLARGGLSNVWGAAMLPYLQDDMTDWPVRLEDLAPYYRSVLDVVPLAGARDALDELLPLYSDSAEPLTPTRQMASFLRDLSANADRLRELGVFAGRSRLAVWTKAGPHGPGCRYIGLCLHGCPYGAIYNSASTLQELLRTASVSYRAGVCVESLEEARGKVRLSVRTLGDGERSSLHADRVFVACGVLATTKLLLESAEAYDHPLHLRDSQYFTLPLLRLTHERVAVRESGNTLAQAFLEILDPSLCRNTVHLQLYGYNDFIRTELAARLHIGERLAEQLLQPLLGRLLFAQGYVHSDFSGGLTAHLARDREGSRLVVEPGDTRIAEPTISAVVDKLQRARRWTKAIPLRPLLQVGLPGKSFHVGGAFPMRAEPGPFESDVLGRPLGLRRVHVVDASVFPSVPATTVTLSVMANAQRIAALHGED